MKHMFLLAGLLALLLAVGVAHSTSVPRILSAMSSPMKSDPSLSYVNGCTPTSAPLVVTPSEIFQGYWCLNETLWGINGARCTMWHYDSTILNGGRWTLKYAGHTQSARNCFPEPPVLISQSIRSVNVVAYSSTWEFSTKMTETWVLGFDSSRTPSGPQDSPNPLWIKDTDRNLKGGLAVDSKTLSVFYARGNHQNPAKPNEVEIITSLECVHGLTGEEIWQNGTGYSKDATLSKPIYYEGHVYFMAAQWLHMVPSDTGKFGSGSSTKTNPCGFVNTDDVKMDLVDFGFEPSVGSPGGFSKLSALILSGNAKTTTNPNAEVHFNLCRIHHGSYLFGEVEQFQYERSEMNLTVNGISGGDNATFVTFLENAEVAVFNCSNLDWPTSKDRLVANFSRFDDDRYNLPRVLYHSTPGAVQTKPPLVVLGSYGELVTWNSWTHSRGWTLPVGCRWSSVPALQSTTLFCAGGGSSDFHLSDGAARVNYDGDLLWEGRLEAYYPPVVVGDVEVFYSGTGVVGVSFVGEAPSGGNPKDKGGNAGVIVLAIFLVLFSLVAIAGISRYILRGRGSSYNSLKPGVNAISREEADGGKTTLSTRSLQDVEAGEGGYGGISKE